MRPDRCRSIGRIAAFVQRNAPLEVRVEHGVPIVLGESHQQVVPGDACVVHEDVDSTEGLDRRVHEPVGLLCAGDAGLKRYSGAAARRDLADYGGGIVLAGVVVHHHACAFCREPQGDGPADASACAGYEGALAFEPTHR